MAVATLINLVAFVLILLSFPFDASKVSRSQDEYFVMNNTTSVAVRIFMSKQSKQQGF